MSAARFFIATQCAAGLEFELEPDDAHHAAHVLRLQRGDRIVALDAGGPWEAEIVAITKHRVRARALHPSAETGGELPVKITVLQALTKGSKFDDVVEKCVELGAHRIVPVVCARSYADAGFHRLQRWRRLAKAAAQQSRRRVLPTVADVVAWGEAVANAQPLLVAWESAQPGSLANALERLGPAPELAIAVGPEGSFTGDELEVALAAGSTLVSLGPTILRTETAAAAMLAAITSKAW